MSIEKNDSVNSFEKGAIGSIKEKLIVSKEEWLVAERASQILQSVDDVLVKGEAIKRVSVSSEEKESIADDKYSLSCFEEVWLGEAVLVDGDIVNRGSVSSEEKERVADDKYSLSCF